MLGSITNRVGREAPEFPKDAEWLNTDIKPSIASLKGQVVILDFWTYCCINCMHMLDTLAEVEKKYEGKPVFIIGVHSAKYDNENVRENVIEAIKRYKIGHAVLFDKKMEMWREFGVNAWPTLIVIGPSGKIEHRHPGEISADQLSSIIDYVSKKNAGEMASSGIHTEHMDFESGKKLSYPGKISISQNQKFMAISDSGNNRIVIAELAGRRVIDVIGSGADGITDGGFGSARLTSPQGTAWDGNDMLYIADTGNHAIRLADLRNKRLSTVAGSGEQGGYISFGSRYENGSAQLSSPWDLCIQGDVLYIAMAGLHQIWSMDIKAGKIGPFAGEGHENIRDGDLESALFAQPSGIFSSGNVLYVADSEVSSVRAINLDTGYVSTLVSGGLFEYGDSAGNIVSTSLQHPLGVSVKDSKIYIADTYNNAIKEVDMVSGSSHRLIGKSGMESACRLDDPECEKLGLYEPSDVKPCDNMLYIADTDNSLVRTFDIEKKVLGTFDIIGL